MRNPVMNAIGPVVADGRWLAVFVVGENQTVFWFAVVVDRERQTESPARCSFGKVDVKLAVFVCELELTSS